MSDEIRIPVKFDVDENQLKKTAGRMDSVLSDKKVKVDIEVDSTQAQKGVDDVAKAVDKISDKKVKVDADTSNAKKKINELKDDLKKVTDAKFKVDVDTTKAVSSLKKLKKYAGEIGDKLKNSYKKSVDALKDLKNNTDGLKGALKDTFSDGIKSVQGMSSHLGQFGGIVEALGPKLAALGPAGAAAAATIAAAFAAIKLGGFLDDINTEIAAVKNLGNVTKEEASKIQGDIKAISEVFGTDYKENIEAVKSATKILGGDLEENVKIIEEGYLAGADASGEYLSMLKEYPAAMKQSGISLKEFVALSALQTQQGIFSDKGIDTIKETGISLREQTKGTKDAMEAAFGKSFTEKILKGVKEGSLSTLDALKQIAPLLDGLDQTAREGIIANVFRGAGEDALPFIKMLSDTNLNIDNLKKNTGKLAEKQKQQLDIQKAQNGAMNNLAQKLEPVIDMFIKWGSEVMTSIYEGLNEVWDAIEAIYKILEPIIDIILLPIKVTFGLISEAVKAVWAYVKELVDVLQFVGSVVSWLYRLFKELVMKALQPVIDFLTGMFDSIKNAIMPALDWIKKQIDLVVDFFKGIIDTAAGVANSLGLISDKTYKDLQKSLMGVEEKEKAIGKAGIKAGDDINKGMHKAAKGADYLGSILTNVNKKIQDLMKKAQEEEKKREAARKKAIEQAKRDAEKQKALAEKQAETLKKAKEDAINYSETVSKLKGNIDFKDSQKAIEKQINNYKILQKETDKRYKIELGKAAGNNKRILEIDSKYFADKVRLGVESLELIGEKEKKAIERQKESSIKAEEKSYNDKLALNKKSLEDNLITQEQYNSLQISLEKTKSERIKLVTDEYNEQIKDKEKETADKINEYKIDKAQEAQDKLLNAEKERLQEEIEANRQAAEAKKQLQQASMDFALDVYKELTSGNKEEIEERYEDTKAGFNKDKKELKKKLAKDEISIEEYQSKLADLNEAQIKAEKEKNKALEEAHASFGMIILQQTFEIAKKQALMKLPDIFAEAFSSLGPIAGPVAAGVATATIWALIDQAQGLLGAEEGRLPGVKAAGKPGVGDTELLWTNPQEAILSPAMTQKNRKFLEHIFSGGDETDYFPTVGVVQNNNDYLYTKLLNRLESPIRAESNINLEITDKTKTKIRARSSVLRHR